MRRRGGHSALLRLSALCHREAHGTGERNDDRLHATTPATRATRRARQRARHRARHGVRDRDHCHGRPQLLRNRPEGERDASAPTRRSRPRATAPCRPPSNISSRTRRTTAERPAAPPACCSSYRPPGSNQPASYVTCDAVKIDKTPGNGDGTSDAPGYAILTLGQRANTPSNQGNYNGTTFLGSAQTSEQGVFFQPAVTGAVRRRFVPRLAERRHRLLARHLLQADRQRRDRRQGLLELVDRRQQPDRRRQPAAVDQRQHEVRLHRAPAVHRFGRRRDQPDMLGASPATTATRRRARIPATRRAASGPRARATSRPRSACRVARRARSCASRRVGTRARRR